MTTFEELNKIDVNDHTEKKQGLTYLSWSWAIAEVYKRYPDMTYEIKTFENGLPYQYDPLTGYMVWTSVTIKGETKIMWLPVMDSSNKAMKSEAYTYKVKSYGKIEEKTVQPATMFDINKTIMRCLVKNFAMFGLGLYIYAGEDLPEETEKPEKSDFEKEATKEKSANTKAIHKAIKEGKEELPPKKETKTLDERYISCLDFLNKQTTETYKNAKPSVIDSINRLIFDLEQAKDERATVLVEKTRTLAELEDEVIY